MSKLKELDVLLKSGAIDENEYKALKNKLGIESDTSNDDVKGKIDKKDSITSSKTVKNKLFDQNSKLKELDNLLKSGAINKTEHKLISNKLGSKIDVSNKGKDLKSDVIDTSSEIKLDTEDSEIKDVKVEPVKNEPKENVPKKAITIKAKWHEKNRNIIIMLILFFPIGLYFMWKNKLWTKTTRWIITIIIVAYIFFPTDNNTSSSSDNEKNDNRSVIIEEVISNSSVVEEVIFNSTVEEEAISNSTINENNNENNVKKSKSLGVINDPDGYTNIRADKSSSSEIIYQIFDENKRFEILNDNSSWWKIKFNIDEYPYEIIGFIHNSRVELIQSDEDFNNYKNAYINANNLNFRSSPEINNQNIITQLQEWTNVKILSSVNKTLTDINHCIAEKNILVNIDSVEIVILSGKMLDVLSMKDSYIICGYLENNGDYNKFNVKYEDVDIIRQEKWYKIEFKDNIGYIYQNFVTLY